MLWNIKKLSLAEVKKGVENQTKIQEEFDSAFDSSGLRTPDISVDGFKINFATKKWLFSTNLFQQWKVMSFDDVEDAWVETVQSGDMKKDTSGYLSRAIIGGVLAGPAGAIIGATTNSDTTSLNLSNQYILNLRLRGIPEAQSVLMSDRHNAQIVCDALLNDRVKQSEKPSNEPTLANKLREFKSLLDEGIIDEEEFQKLKKSLIE
ncbi:hypothetical protein DSECCO2_530160 [anaerobic digester metagenome]